MLETLAKLFPRLSNMTATNMMGLVFHRFIDDFIRKTIFYFWLTRMKVNCDQFENSERTNTNANESIVSAQL